MTFSVASGAYQGHRHQHRPRLRHHHSNVAVFDINASSDAVSNINVKTNVVSNTICNQFAPNPTQHRPRRLIEEAREDEATMSFIKPDDSVMTVRLKGEVWGY